MPTNCKHRWAVRAPILMVVLAAAGSSWAETPRITPSGLPVPRYLSLKYDPVNARQGPDEEHRLMWTYHAKGLPVQVVAETREWRRICDPNGDLTWVHKRTTDGKRTVMRVQPGDLPLLASPRAGARVTAYLRSQAVAGLDRCDKGWCRLRADGAKGWAPETAVWGTAPGPQCR